MGRDKGRRSAALPAPQKNKGGSSAKGSDERPASTYDHGDSVYKIAKGRGGIYIGRESYRVAYIVVEVKTVGCPGYNVRWEGLHEEANTTEYDANVKSQGHWGDVLEPPSSKLIRCVPLCRLVYYFVHCPVGSRSRCAGFARFTRLFFPFSVKLFVSSKTKKI
jgi:hypothetical protein